MVHSCGIVGMSEPWVLLTRSVCALLKLINFHGHLRTFLWVEVKSHFGYNSKFTKPQTLEKCIFFLSQIIIVLHLTPLKFQVRQTWLWATQIRTACIRRAKEQRQPHGSVLGHCITTLLHVCCVPRGNLGGFSRLEQFTGNRVVMVDSWSNCVWIGKNCLLSPYGGGKLPTDFRGGSASLDFPSFFWIY